MGKTSLHRQMTALARDLQSQESPEAALQLVVDAARELIEPCVAAGITLATRQGQIRTSAATGSVPRRSDQLQIEHDEGPCRDAVWEHHTVVVRNLPYEHRWPTWAPVAASELGMRSMLCLRLFTHADRVGALNLFSPEPDAFDEESVETGHAVAAHAAVAFAEANRIGHLEAALVNRTVIGQATGILMNGYGMTSSAAFAALRRLSSQGNRKLHVIAKEMVDQHDRGQQRKVQEGIARMRPRTRGQDRA